MNYIIYCGTDQLEILRSADSCFVAEAKVKSCRSIVELHRLLEVSHRFLVFSQLHARHPNTMINLSHHLLVGLL